ncbi:hypothetical protein E8L90_06550 [Brevibacillus antibioticus]|uniref:Uncharacterized protein n=1 Tax=Brevibacillus antibioticus TaxID=2570228 RepID=A0A4U2Y3Z7_9BACL|nr:hypothetical protein [Brevibacillus antibioticus]TKI55139.1 hypothetical protein E8L90_06550 [Brevibacillus antibioticus]
MTDEIKDLQKGITKILVAIGKIETEIKQLGIMANKLDSTEKMAIEAMQSTKAAHKRLDELGVEITDLSKKAEDIKKEIEKRIDEDKRQGRDDKRWIVGTVLGAGAFIWKLIEIIAKGGRTM